VSSLPAAIKLSRPLSVRARVTIAATAAVALVLIGGGILTVATFAQRERSSFDRELERRAQGPAGRPAEFLTPALGGKGLGERGPRGGERPPGDVSDGRSVSEGTSPEAGIGGPPGLLAESGFFVRVIENGQVVRAAGDVPDESFPISEKTGFETFESGGRSWRTLTIGPPSRIRSGADELVRRAQFAADLDPLENRIGEMRSRVALISGLGIGLAAVLASLLSGLALAPLSRLRRTVAGVTSTRDLSHRLPESDAAEEVSELARSVNEMLTRLENSTAETESALEATRRFAADVGHELRTPLTSIRANLDALRRNPTMPEPDRRAILEEVAAEQRDLVTLLDALQALARGDAGAALPRESLDFADIVDAAVESARRRHPEARIDLSSPDERQQVNGWPDGLRLVVDNLVENAIRHGGSNVRIGLRRTSVGGDLLLSVEDDGPGVPGVDREHIFERFQRGSGAIGPGSGLGLALVAQQASLHGGNVEVGDSPLGGASFEVRLPLADDR
jgi:two-component system, OmpR family, sensor histidine kinase PrrB